MCLLLNYSPKCTSELIINQFKKASQMKKCMDLNFGSFSIFLFCLLYSLLNKDVRWTWASLAMNSHLQQTIIQNIDATLEVGILFIVHRAHILICRDSQIYEKGELYNKTNRSPKQLGTWAHHVPLPKHWRPQYAKLSDGSKSKTNQSMVHEHKKGRF